MVHIYFLNQGVVRGRPSFTELVARSVIKSEGVIGNFNQSTLTIDIGHLDDAAKFLSLDELIRVDRFYRLNDRKNFIYAHATLRLLLSYYCSCDPLLIDFSYGVHGKPHVSNLDESLHFSISYGKDLQCIAISDTEVGVDLQFPVKGLDARGIASGFYTQEERNILEGLLDDEYLSFFYTLWARKEALIKASGLNLDHMGKINSLENDLNLIENERLLKRYQVESLPNHAGHFSAMAWRID